MRFDAVRNEVDRRVDDPCLGWHCSTTYGYGETRFPNIPVVVASMHPGHEWPDAEYRHVLVENEKGIGRYAATGEKVTITPFVPWPDDQTIEV